MLELDEVRALVERFDPKSLTHVWRHPDPRVDALQQELERAVGARLNAPREEMFAIAWQLAHEAAGLSIAPPAPLSLGRRCRISTNPGTVERSPRQSRWL